MLHVWEKPKRIEKLCYRKYLSQWNSIPFCFSSPFFEVTSILIRFQKVESKHCRPLIGQSEQVVSSSALWCRIFQTLICFLSSLLCCSLQHFLNQRLFPCCDKQPHMCSALCVVSVWLSKKERGGQKTDEGCEQSKKGKKSSSCICCQSCTESVTWGHLINASASHVFRAVSPVVSLQNPASNTPPTCKSTVRGGNRKQLSHWGTVTTGYIWVLQWKLQDCKWQMFFVILGPDLHAHAWATTKERERGRSNWKEEELSCESSWWNGSTLLALIVCTMHSCLVTCTAHVSSCIHV